MSSFNIRPNNIFSFSAKELIQDSFIAWLLNGYGSSESATKTAIDFLNFLYGGKTPEHIENIDVATQFHEIDILCVLNHKYALIIEDKTYTTEHSNQIGNYIYYLQKYGVTYPDGSHIHVSHENIHVAYLKTGFWNDHDNSISKLNYQGVTVTAVHANEWLNLLRKQEQRELPMITDFVQHLETAFVQPQWVAKKRFEDFDYYDINSQNPLTANDEQVIMNYLFPMRYVEIDAKQHLVPTKQKSGAISPAALDYGISSSGKPWIQYNIWSYPNTHTALDGPRIFWRLDTDAQGPYLALKLYTERHLLSHVKQERDNLYQELYSKLNSIPNQNSALNQFAKFHQTPSPVSKSRSKYELPLLYIPFNGSPEHPQKELRNMNQLAKLTTTYTKFIQDPDNVVWNPIIKN